MVDWIVEFESNELDADRFWNLKKNETKYKRNISISAKQINEADDAVVVGRGLAKSHIQII